MLNYLKSLCKFPVSCHLTLPCSVISSHSVCINFSITITAVITSMTVQQPLGVWKMTKWLIGFSQPIPITKPRLGFWASGSSLVAHNASDDQHKVDVRDGVYYQTWVISHFCYGKTSLDATINARLACDWPVRVRLCTSMRAETSSQFLHCKTPVLGWRTGITSLNCQPSNLVVFGVDTQT